MKPRTHRLTTELIILSCMLLLKAIDLQTDCVAATVAVLKRAVNITPHSEFAYTGLWDASGGLSQMDSRDRASGRARTMPDSTPIRKDPKGVKPCPNLGTAHYQLAASEFWQWKNKARYRQ
jgi:hypothetical protein